MQNPNTDKQLLWSPFKDDEFILYGNNILFYKITGFDSSFNRNRVDSNLFVSDNSYAKLVGSINNYQGQKLLSWYPSEIGYNNYHLIALHEMNQDQIRLLSLSSFNSSENLADNEINILKMEHARVSNQLKWQPIWQSSLLGLGCEEYEDASSIYIFDINRPNKHVYELSEFSSCLSLCWHPENSDILFAGVASQNISLFDFRVGSGAAETVHTGFVRAFSIDPKNAYRAVSHEGARIAVWDLRKFGCGPVGLMEEQKAVKCMQFCPAKADRLAVLTENSNYVNVYRIEERDEHIYKQTVNCKGSKSTFLVLIHSSTMP